MIPAVTRTLVASPAKFNGYLEVRMTRQQEALKAIYKELMVIAQEEGQRERERLGRELTKAEVQCLADMIARQFETAWP